jgi:glycerol uptake facilitator-like aquaporin
MDSVVSLLSRPTIVFSSSANNVPKANITPVQGLFMEMFLTAELILAIFMLAVEKVKYLACSYKAEYQLTPLESTELPSSHLSVSEPLCSLATSSASITLALD